MQKKTESDGELRELYDEGLKESLVIRRPRCLSATQGTRGWSSPLGHQQQYHHLIELGHVRQLGTMSSREKLFSRPQVSNGQMG